MSNYRALFDGKAQEYSKFRPGYPPALYQFLQSCVSARSMAWDAGTGNGQAALELAKFFDQVVATDSSQAQIEQAPASDNITFRVAPAECSGLADASCDLITAANAVHWFDHNKFFKECERVLKPEGVVAIWCYNSIDAQDSTVETFCQILKEKIRPYWPDRVQLVYDRYQTLHFPFEEIEAPKFSMTESWTIMQFAGYCSTWSAVSRYQEAIGGDPIAQWLEQLPETISPTQHYNFHFPLPARLGRKTL